MMTLILSQKLDMDASSIASLLLVFNIIFIPCMMLSGYLTDCFSKQKVIIAYDLVTVISYLLISFSMFIFVQDFILSLFLC